jgi:hypothetical protein
MLEHNRNLSSIVGTIQDEVPSESASTGQTTRLKDVSNQAGSLRAGRRRSGWRSFLYLLLATLVLVAAFIFVAGGRGGYLADLPYGAGEYIPKLYNRAESAIASLAGSVSPAGEGEAVVPGVVVEQADSSSNEEIREQQSLIQKRLEELSSAIEDIRESNNQHRVDARREQERLKEDFQRQIAKVSATVAGLQGRLAARNEDSIQPSKGARDITATKTGSGKVSSEGGWVVNVANSPYIEPIEKLKNKLQKRGIQTEIHEALVGGKPRYRLRIPGFSTSDEAKKYARNLDSDLGLKDPWVNRR